MGNTGNGFDKDSKRASEAGARSKRGHSWQRAAKAILDLGYAEDPTKKYSEEDRKDIKQELKDRGLNVSDLTFRKAIAARTILDAVNGDIQATKFIKETEVGREAQSLIGDPDSPLEVNHNLDEAVLKALEKIKGIE